ncbi:MAG UNVERIFIED_CONTAM: hypothetical protein LVQ98_05670 [Rickettsiaceae bacterium]|jgi:hypothetical protein
MRNDNTAILSLADKTEVKIMRSAIADIVDRKNVPAATNSESKVPAEKVKTSPAKKVVAPAKKAKAPAKKAAAKTEKKPVKKTAASTPKKPTKKGK